MIVLRKKTLLVTSLIYIYIPVLIFLIGFTKIYICLAVIACLGFVAYRIGGFIKGEQFKNSSLEIDIRFFMAGCFFLLAVGFFAGWGRWVNQTYDWYKHNAVLQDLVDRSWPVYYVNGEEKSMLTYYVGQYLVPAVFGKMFSSFRVAEIMVYIWSEIGLILVWMNLLLFMQKKNKWGQMTITFMLIFFSVPQALTEVLVKVLCGIDCLYSNCIKIIDKGIIIQYSGNGVCINWVFNQTIVTWLIVLIFLMNTDRIEYYLFYMIPGILFSIFTFVGVVLIAFGHFVYMMIKQKEHIALMKKTFSVENIITFCTLGIIMALFYYGNVFGVKPAGVSLRMLWYGNKIGAYLVFIICNVFLYAIYTFKANKKNDLFWISFGTLIVLPFFSVGIYNDFVMRTSIPALFIVMCMITDYLIEQFKCAQKKTVKKNILYIALIGILINASTYQVHVFINKLSHEKEYEVSEIKTNESLEYYANRTYKALSEEERHNLLENQLGKEVLFDFKDDMIYNYYSYDLEDNLFYMHVAQRGIDCEAN